MPREASQLLVISSERKRHTVVTSSLPVSLQDPDSSVFCHSLLPQDIVQFPRHILAATAWRIQMDSNLQESELDKMSGHSDSDSTAPSGPLPDQVDESRDIEKIATSNTNRSKHGSPAKRAVTAQDWSGPDDPRTRGTGLYGKDYTIRHWWECFALQCKKFDITCPELIAYVAIAHSHLQYIPLAYLTWRNISASLRKLPSCR